MLIPTATKWHTSSNSIKPYEETIEKKTLSCQDLLSRQPQLSSVNTAQTIEELFAQYLGELWPESPTNPQAFI